MYLKNNVVWKIRDYGSILYDLKTQNRLKLNNIGTRIFLLYFNRRHSREEIIKTLLYDFADVNVSQVKEDVNNFFDTIEASDMVTKDAKKRGIINLLEVNPPLDSCTFVITRRCNLDCKHCFVSGSKKTDELSTDEIKKVIDELETLKVLDLTITGGEPLLRDDLPEILKYCHKKNIYTTVFTNGVLITDDFIDKIKNLNVTIRISVDGASAETNDYLRGKGTFEKAVSAIRKSIKSGLKTGIATAIYKDNLNEYDEIIGLALQLGVSELEISEVISIGNAKDHLDIILTEKEVEYLRLLNLKRSFDTDILRAGLGLDRITDRFFDKSEDIGRKMCSAGRSTCTITSEGNVFPCQLFCEFPEMKAGNLKEEYLVDIWGESIVFESFRNLDAKDIENCTSCECLDSCAGGCRARAYTESNSLYAPMSNSFCNATKNIYKKFLEGGVK